MKTNKQLIDELQAYFLEQDPAIVARLLANSMIDLHRWKNFETLDDETLTNLIYRTTANSITLIKFSKEGPDGALSMGPLE